MIMRTYVFLFFAALLSACRENVQPVLVISHTDKTISREQLRDFNNDFRTTLVLAMGLKQRGC